MAFKTDVQIGAENKAAMESRGIGPKTDAPALIGMSLRQDIAGGLLSGRTELSNLILKRNLIPIQDDPEKGGGGVGVLQRDAHANAECRDAESGSDPGVPQAQPGDRVHRAKPGRGIRLGAADVGGPGVCPVRQETARQAPGLYPEGDGAQSAADCAAGWNVPGHRNPGTESEAKQEGCGNAGAVESVENQKQDSHPSHRPLELSPTARDSHIPTARLRPGWKSGKPKAGFPLSHAGLATMNPIYTSKDLKAHNGRAGGPTERKTAVKPPFCRPRLQGQLVLVSEVRFSIILRLENAR